MTRDLDKNPYSPDEQRVADWLCKRSGENIGGGDDPIGFLMVSYEYVMASNANLRREVMNLSAKVDEFMELKGL